MHECLQQPVVQEALMVTRRRTEMTHPKLREIVHENFFDLSAIEQQLSGYDACFFCLGVSSIGLKEPEYFRLTHTLTMHFAETLLRHNSKMVFCYVSGMGTDSSVKGRSMWARVKGKTENDLMKLSFRKVYAFRPGIIQPTKGLRRTLSFYKYFNWLFPIGKRLLPSWFCTLRDIGVAMIRVATTDYSSNIIECKDITALGNEGRIEIEKTI